MIWIAIGLGIAGIVAIVVWRVALLIPGAPVAEVEALVREPFPFELNYTTTTNRAYRLALRLRMHGEGWGGVDNMGILCRYRVAIDGELFKEELVGIGADLPRTPDRRITQAYMSSDMNNGSDYTSSSIRVLTEIPKCPAGREIVVTGHFEPKLGTTTSKLNVFLGR